MNLVDNPYSLEKDEAQLALNVDLGIRDVLNSRKGFTEAGLSAELQSQTKLVRSADTIAKIPVGSGTVWQNPGAITKPGTAEAALAEHIGGGSGAGQTNWLVGYNCGFALPVGAVPVGFSVRTKSWGNVSDFSGAKLVETVSLSKEAFSPTKSRKSMGSSTLQSEIHDYVYGGSESIVFAGITKAEVEAEGFGVIIEDSPNIPSTVWGVETFEAEITVYYLIPGVGTDVITHMRPWYPGANRYLVLSANGKIKVLKAEEIVTLFTGTAGTTWDFEQMESAISGSNVDYLFAMNGVDSPQYLNLTLLGEGKTATWNTTNEKGPKGSMMRVWKNRMIISGVAAFPQRLFFSDVGNFNSPADSTNGGYGNNWVDIKTSEDDTDPITWLEIIDDVLLIFKKKSTWAVYEDEKFGNYKIANVGCEGRFLSCVLDDRCYFANRYGVYSVTAEGSPRYESLNIEPLFKGEAPEALGGSLGAIDLEGLGKYGRMAALPNGRIYLACGPVGGVNDEGFLTDGAGKYLLEGYPRLRRARKGDERTPWVTHEFAKSRIKAICLYRTKDSEVDQIVSGLVNELGSSPQLVRLFYSERDGVEPIAWRWVSSRRPEISEEPFERIRRVNLLMSGKVQAKVVSDEQESAIVTLESPEESMQRFRPETWGRYHYLELFEEGQTPTSIYAVEFAFRGGKEH
jgi:hypothetical protein